MKNSSRLKFLRIALCLGFIFGILFSFELWFPVARSFPRVPMSVESTVWVDRILTVILVISLIFSAVSFRPKIFLSSAAFALVLLVFFDQMRLQPWVYQYLLLIIILALQSKDETDSEQTLCPAQIIIAGLYFWSGVQKLNFTFSDETLPLLLAPVQNLFPSAYLPYVFIGIIIALAEALIGGGLLFRKTRNLSVVSAVIMHTGILILLIAKNYNSIVWIWNAFLMAAVAILFWKNDVSIKQMLFSANEKKRKFRFAGSIAATSVLLPVLSFAGFWDMYLSGALYSGNTAVGVVRINDDLYEKLPPKARQSVFQTKSGGEKILPFHEWAIAELNVPAYPANRVFKKITNEVCRLTGDKNQVELIIKMRPAILDGKYDLMRINCDLLEK